MAIRRWLRRRRRLTNEEFAAEIQSHLAHAADDRVARGTAPDEARLAALRAFGNVTSARERFYESRRVAVWDRLVQDVRFALRLRARTPLVSASILLTLALGIGIASAVFSLLEAVVLRPLPYEKPRELVQLFETGSRPGGEADWLSFPNFRDWQRESRVFDGLAAYRYALLTIVDRHGADSLLGLETTDTLFRVLHVDPMLGRVFRPGDDGPSAERVTVISYGLWQRRFGSDPHVIGRALSIDGVPHTIVGVMPASFRFPLAMPFDMAVPIDTWIPMRPSGDLEDRGSHNFWAVGRLRPGVGVVEARTAMRTIADNLARAYPDSNKDFSVAVVPLAEYVAGSLRPALLLLLAAVAIVLLLTCANVANLLLSHAQTRRHELAVRLALGAGRARLVRQTLTESLLLALAGGGLGIAIAVLGTPVLIRVAPPNIPRLEETVVDGHVLAFTCVVSIFVGLLFGMAPAVLSSHGSASGALRDAGTRVSEGAAARMVRQALVVGQVALAIMLLVGAGLLIRSFTRVTGLDLGFRPPHLLTAFINLPPSRYGEPSHQAAFFDEALRRIERLPGVEAAAVSDSVPLTGVNDQGSLMIDGRADPRGDDEGSFYANRPHVSPGYFDTMGIRLLEGRLFDARDRSDSLPVAIVSDIAARRYWPGRSSIGQRVAVDWIDNHPVWRHVVGVVQSTRHFGLEAPQKPEIYVPHVQSPSPFMQLVVRAAYDPASLQSAIRTQIAGIDPQQGVTAFQTFEDLVSLSSARRRFQTALVGVFALLALVLAAVGVYSVMSYMVVQRRREIGVRLALGAAPAEVVRMVLGNGLWLTVCGVVLGVAAALALSSTLGHFLYGVSALDPLTYVAVTVALVGISALAAYVPSRGAAHVDPMLVLRDQ
jgi:putative ABC transport system permease protein